MSKRDLAASVRQRLLNQAQGQDRPFQEMLQYFAMERFLYRLSISAHRDRFVLKGALLLTAWRAPQSRPTVDIDFAGRTSNEPVHIREMIQQICSIDIVPDGLQFDPATRAAGNPEKRMRRLCLVDLQLTGPLSFSAMRKEPLRSRREVTKEP